MVGLGPGRPGLMTSEALAAIAATPVRWLRTSRHPSAGAVPGAPQLRLPLRVRRQHGRGLRRHRRRPGSAPRPSERRIIYAVPGSPVVAERSVELLRADARVTTVLLPGVSFVDLAFSRLGVDPLAAGVRLVDGHRFAVEAAGSRGPLLVGQCDSLAVLSEVKLAIGSVLDQQGPGHEADQQSGRPRQLRGDGPPAPRAA